MDTELQFSVVLVDFVCKNFTQKNLKQIRMYRSCNSQLWWDTQKLQSSVVVGDFVCKNFSRQRSSGDLKTAEKNVFVMFHNEQPASCFGMHFFVAQTILFVMLVIFTIFVMFLNEQASFLEFIFFAQTILLAMFAIFVIFVMFHN